MQTLSSAKVQANFGQTLDLAKSGEPVTITQYGRPTVMLLPFKEAQVLLQLKASADFKAYFEGRASNAAENNAELSLDEVNALVHELRP